MQITWRLWESWETLPWPAFARELEGLIAEHRVRRVCEVGAGANPVLGIEVIEQLGVEYVLLDISESELAKAPGGYVKAVADITAEDFDAAGDFDLVVSQTLAEHVEDPARLHTNVCRLLRPGGRALHFFPTLYEPLFVANRLLPERLSEALLMRIQPTRRKGGRKEKFEAYYRWCRGPTPRQLSRLQRVGFEVERYTGWFGHNYFIKLAPLHRLHLALSRFLLRRRLATLTTYAWIQLRRPS